MGFIPFALVAGNTPLPLPIPDGGSGVTTAAAALAAFGGAAVTGGDIGGTSAAPTVTATHLASPLPATQGGTGLAAALAASLNTLPSAPTSTTSTTAVYAGFGIQFTPLASGKIWVEGSCEIGVSTALTSVLVNGRYGPLAGATPTTVAAGSAGAAAISTIATWAQPSAGVLNVASTAGFAAAGTIWVTTSGANQPAQIAYTSITGGATPSFNGCTFVQGGNAGANTVTTGNAVSGSPLNGALVAANPVSFRWGASSEQGIRPQASGQFTYVSFAQALTATVANQAYWFDMVFATTNAADAANMQSISINIFELLA